MSELSTIIDLLTSISGGNDFTIIKTSALTGLKLKKIVVLSDAVFTALASGSVDMFVAKNFESTTYPAGTIFTFVNNPITAVTMASGVAIGYN